MPLYVVDKKLDRLNSDAFVFPFLDNEKLYRFYRDSKLNGYSINSYLSKIDNKITTKSLLKKNQIVYFVEDDGDKFYEYKIPVVLTSCQLPEVASYNELNNSDKELIFTQEKEILAKFYQRILRTALNNQFQRIAIPIIISEYSNSQSYIDFARSVVREFIDNIFEELTVFLLLTDSDNEYFSEEERVRYYQRIKLESGLCSRFWTNYANKNDRYNDFVCYDEQKYWHKFLFGRGAYCISPPSNLSSIKKKREKEKADWKKLKGKNKFKSSTSEIEDIDKFIDERLKVRDESFSEMVIRKINENGLNSVYCYKVANVGRNIFSKITKDANKDENEDGTRYIYHPDKKIALAFAIALHLKQTEAEELLQKAGFSFSNSPQDIIVKIFIEKGIYDIDLLNQQLLKHDLLLLGSTTK